MKFDKTEVARRQLGAALHLFLEDADPVSVHILASGGMELADALAKKAGKPTFKAIAIEANPALTEARYHELKNQWWNSFKHVSGRKGHERNDAELLADFNDAANEHALLIGWLDLGTATGSMPIEAQVFQAWFFAVHPENLAPDARINGPDEIFPGIRLKRRAEQKEALRRQIRKVRRDRALMDSPMTERRNLLLPNNLDQFERPR